MNNEYLDENLEEEKSILDIYPDYLYELSTAIQNTIERFNVDLINKLDIIAPSDMISSLSDLVILSVEGSGLDGEGDD